VKFWNHGPGLINDYCNLTQIAVTFAQEFDNEAAKYLSKIANKGTKV
jgi:hypothetical protein